MVDAATTLATSLHWCSAGHLLFMGGCYDTRAAPGSGVCREARDGACARHAEEVMRNDEPGSKVAESTTCQAAASGSTKCAENMCNVWIGGKDYCSECATADELLIDGACVPASGQDTKCKTNSQGACSSCGDGYFLHKGGCYKIGQAPGNAICTNTQASSTVGNALPVHRATSRTQQLLVLLCRRTSRATTRLDSRIVIALHTRVF